jgi:hypothetical protein
MLKIGALAPLGAAMLLAGTMVAHSAPLSNDLSNSTAGLVLARFGGGGGGHGGGGGGGHGGGGWSGGGRGGSFVSRGGGGGRSAFYGRPGGHHGGHGGHHHGHGGGVAVFVAPGYDYGDDYDYYDDDSCAWLYSRAENSGSSYWWRRYRNECG